MRDNFVAVVDHGLGNLFSVRQACRQVGLDARVTADPDEVASAAAVILPGVGAFGHAMTQLRDRGLIPALEEVASSGVPLIGICLGMQLLMDVSHEFGVHEGLGLIPGRVELLAERSPSVKLPHMGWNDISTAATPADDPWAETPLAGLPGPVSMYFVHSFVAVPDDSEVAIGYTTYAKRTFCSAVRSDNVFGVQFHPERSGAQGLKIYANIARIVSDKAAA